MKKAKWELYIILTQSDQLYTGITTDLDRRFEEHCSGKKGARFFRTSAPVKIVYRESHRNRSQASRRESAIKKMTREQKLSLIKKNPLT